VNTGRFVGSRGRNSGARLEDTITKNNLEAVKEVVRQLRLRDIGGIIVIDFIDMANPKNRATVEEALRTELERDRTKTYVVEISPLGLVEMTRQNVTDGPREVMTRKCPTCGGDGIVYSEASAAIDVERRLRALSAGSRSQAFAVELAAPIASALVGPGARRLIELEALTKRRFFLTGKPNMHLDHFVVLREGKLAELAPAAPVAEGAEVHLELVEVDRHDSSAAVGKADGFDVCVGEAAELVGKKVKVRVERVLEGVAYATLVRRAGRAVPEPLTAEAEAEKPTRRPPARKAAGAPGAELEDAAVPAADEPELMEIEEIEAVEPEAEEPVVVVEEAEAAGEEPEGEQPEAGTPARKKTRRGSRGGRKRKKTPVEGGAAAEDAVAAADGAEEEEPAPAEEPGPAAETSRTVTIHVPGDELGREPADAAAPGGDGAVPPKKRTRRGSRGGRKRRKPAAASVNGGEPEVEVEVEADAEVEVEVDGGEQVADDDLVAEVEEEPTEWGYVPMSEWGDDLGSSR
jgi:ribonuclease G